MRLKWVMVIVAVCIVVTVAAMAYAVRKPSMEVPEVIRAQRFEVVDAEGSVRGMLGPPAGGPSFALLDANGMKRFQVLLDADGSTHLALLGDAERKQPAVFLSAYERTSKILLTDGTAPRITLALDANGVSSLTFLDDERYRVRASTGLMRDQKPFLMLRDENDRNRAALMVDSDGSPVLKLLDNDGKVLWEAP